MIQEPSSLFDTFSSEEGEASCAAFAQLEQVAWASSLTSALRQAGGVKRENRGLLFELRFAIALLNAGIEARYEVPGEGDSTVDFNFVSARQEWIVELMRLEETRAALAATQSAMADDGTPVGSFCLSTNAKDPTQSEEGETLKVVQRICQKCERDGRPSKFREPDGRFQVLLVDFRTFLHGGDEADIAHIALGGRYVSQECRRYWEDKLISGAFDPHTNVRGAVEMRERVHFLGFVREKSFGPLDFGSSISFVFNPNLFSSTDAAKRALSSWPLQPTRLFFSS